MTLDRKGAVALTMLAILVLTACAAPSPKWTVQPEVRSVRQAQFEAQLHPVNSRGDSGPVIAFDLIVVNLGPKALALDWNRSRYLHNDKPHGPLVFAGVDPQALRESRLPSESLQPGQELRRQIAPLRFLAKAPINDRDAPAGQSRISGGPLPDGKSTVRMVLMLDGEERVQDLTLRISRTTAP
jgi:hypothetical protein